MGKKPIISVTYENETISMKNGLPYLKCVLRLSCVVHGPIYGFLCKRFSLVSVTYENERISIKNSLPYLKCVLRLSCVVHGSIYGRFMGFYVNGFLSYIKTRKNP